MLDHVSKKYHQKYAIKDINITFNEGILHMITGPNGSGKSTILKCIMGILHYDGNIQIQPVKIGYAPEHYVMPDYMTILDFLYQIGRIKSNNSITLNEDLNKLLELFQLKEHQNQMIGKLSNGMKQKVNLIQALIHNPKILLLDEPTNAIDTLTEKNLINYIKTRSKTSLIIISTHQPEKFAFKNKKVYTIQQGCIQG
jgi:ABC-2 type transport system ATP-binding protein